MERAYLITKDHFKVEEVNFTQLKETIDNIILEYRFDSNLEYFKRSLFEMDRLGYNIGILVKSSNISTDSLLSTFISHIKGFEIKLGVWILEDTLANINNLDNGDEIFIGEKLFIPRFYMNRIA